MTILVAAALLTGFLLQIEIDFIEGTLYDARMKWSRGSETSDIVLVAIDDKTTKTLNELAPLPLDFHTRFLESLVSFKPQAIGYLVNMNHVSQINPELFTSDSGKRFVDAARKLESAGVPFIFGTPFDINGETLPPFPLSALDHSIAVIHKDGNIFAEDNVSRRALAWIYGRPAFHLAIANRTGRVSDSFLPGGTFDVPEVDGKYFFFRYHGETSWLDPPNESSHYERFSFIDILEGRVDPAKLSGKTILVGTLIRGNPGDFVLTPFSRKNFSNPKLLVHANILDTVLHNDSIFVAPGWLNAVLTFIVVLSVTWWVLAFTPLYGLAATIGLVLTVLGLGFALFQGFGPVPGIWIHESHPIAGIFLSYYLTVPYRLIVEYKKRWEYQRRSELLTQVEELKTNFLSLITHDLKTPVARIQGLSETLLHKAAERLTDGDHQTVIQVLSATDELNRFISSLLELTQVESRGIVMQIESKDINSLIEKAVDSFKAQANSRGIRIETKLEPLFSVKLDPSLVSKVLNNLIDNAIKYSPTGSLVTVSSAETTDGVEVIVHDQGIGMSEDELKNIFTKFYRAKNDTTTRIAGTGLGLYLTRFFVEAHGGSVSVESKPGVGSCFKIKLPTTPVVLNEATRPGLRLKRWMANNKGKRSIKENANV